MSDKPEKEMIVNGDTKTVIVDNTKHPWNEVPLPKPKQKVVYYKYQLTVQHNDGKELRAVCNDLEEIFSFHKQFVRCDYNFIKLERIEDKPEVK